MVPKQHPSIKIGSHVFILNPVLFLWPTYNTPREKRGHDVFPVLTTDFQRVVMTICLLRGNAWADTVIGRIGFDNYLYASDAIYHQTCNVNVRTG